LDRPLVALVGGETLLAKEVRAALEDLKPVPRVQLIFSAVEGSSLLAADEDEPVVMLPLNAESLEGAKVVLLAGSPASSRRAFKIDAGKIDAAGGPVLIDLVGALEDQPQARLRAPSAEPAAVEQSGPSQPIHVIAHPAAISLALLLSRIAQAGIIRRSVAHVFEPVSEQGQRGLDELHKQTVAVLSFQKLKTDVFDTQVAFGMLARYGEEAEEPLEGIEQRLERHLASLLAGWPGVPMPSLRLIQAPVFHGHSFSVWVEFEENPGVKPISQTLASGGIDVRTDEPPSNIGVAGQSGLSVGAIAVDANNPRACWFWAVSDNLRMTAENAVAVAREIL
jgi:aspartate-semialdehyde dehydrogenase